ncbi:FGGY-family carbohydrate kinase [Cereibacter johrii]|uniref:L-xylulokinase n=1 Tax=Cereibacter johrii TaxID=445629 RepID=A0ABX5J551_9RHOB|nr:FGGY-family carbohydrate kinase [Cereibacter johrii]ODM42433.1 carbohydrate kinase [Cereibacter johrii]PTM78051.1 L-xylulokinase [Cereibacter johrii]
MQDRVIGIDAGGTMTKAALFDLTGQELACARRKNVMAFPAPGWTERDPDAMWAAAAASVREVLERTATDPGRIAAVSVAGYGSGLYLLDAEGAVVRPGIVSTDSRAAGVVADWTASGLATMVEPLIQQRLWAGQSLVLLAWLQRHEPQTVARTHKISFCKDFLRTRLCGDLSTDPSDAGIAGLIDVTTGTYSRDAFRLLGLEGWLDKLPEIGPADEVVGLVSQPAAALTGLRAGTPVVRGAVDVTAAALASGLSREDQMSVVAGTFSINSTLHRTPRMSMSPFLQSAYPLGGYLATEGAATSASNLEWLVKTLLAHGGTLPGDLAGGLYEVVNDAVLRRRGQPRDALFFPFLFGGPDGAPAGLLGMTADYSFDDIMLAVFEGIVFAHKVDIDRLLSGNDAARPGVIRLAGGASRSAIWSEMFADILGLPVEVPEGSELGALGVAICAASAVGAHASLGEAVSAMARTARRHEVEHSRGAAHCAKYPRYRAMTEAMASAWRLPSRGAEAFHA